MRHAGPPAIAPLLGLLAALCIAPGLAAPPAAAADAGAGAGGWPDLPDGTKAVLLVSGSDLGFYFPKGCNNGRGGNLYRVNFDAWLEARHPGVERVWISTGNFSPLQQDGVIGPAETLEHFRRIGYVATGLGAADLQGLAARDAWPSAPPIVSANVVVHETGRHLFAGSVTVDTAAGRILLVGATAPDPGFVAGTPHTGSIVTIDPAPSVRAEIEAAGQEPGLVVLVTSLDDDRLAGLLRQVSGIDLVVASSGVSVAGRTAGPNDGVPIVWAGGEGRWIVRVALAAGGRVLAAERIDVGDEFPVDPRTGEARTASAGAAPPRS